MNTSKDIERRRRRQNEDAEFLEKVREGAQGLSGQALERYTDAATKESWQRPHVMPGHVRDAARRGSGN